MVEIILTKVHSLHTPFCTPFPRPCIGGNWLNQCYPMMIRSMKARIVRRTRGVFVCIVLGTRVWASTVMRYIQHPSLPLFVHSRLEDLSSTSVRVLKCGFHLSRDRSTSHEGGNLETLHSKFECGHRIPRWYTPQSGALALPTPLPNKAIQPVPLSTFLLVLIWHQWRRNEKGKYDKRVPQYRTRFYLCKHVGDVTKTKLLLMDGARRWRSCWYWCCWQRRWRGCHRGCRESKQ